MAESGSELVVGTGDFTIEFWFYDDSNHGGGGSEDAICLITELVVQLLVILRLSLDMLMEVRLSITVPAAVVQLATR